MNRSERPDGRSAGFPYIEREAGETRLIAFESFGARIGIELPGTWTGAEMVTRFPPRAKRVPSRNLHATYRVDAVNGSRRNGTGGERWRITAGDELVDVASGRERTAKVLAHELNFAVARHARGWVFVHAGVVAHRGHLLLFPGSTGSGKSTLVRALVEEGATYYSDDLAPVDRKGRVHAFPRSLRLRDADGFRELPDPEPGKERRAGRPSSIFFLEHEPAESGVGDWRPTLPGTALLLLIQNTVQAKTAPERSIEHLEPAVGSAEARVGKRGDAREAARRVLGAVNDGVPSAERSTDVTGVRNAGLQLDAEIREAVNSPSAAFRTRGHRN